jgi:hypothetical protein
VTRQRKKLHLIGVLTLAAAILGFEALPHPVVRVLALAGMLCSIVVSFRSVRDSSKGKRAGYLFFVIWFMVVGVVILWHEQLWAMPSADEMTLLMELLALGFVLAIGFGVLVEVWCGKSGLQVDRGSSK